MNNANANQVAMVIEACLAVLYKIQESNTTRTVVFIASVTAIYMAATLGSTAISFSPYVTRDSELNVVFWTR